MPTQNPGTRLQVRDAVSQTARFTSWRAEAGDRLTLQVPKMFVGILPPASRFVATSCFPLDGLVLPV